MDSVKLLCMAHEYITRCTGKDSIHEHDHTTDCPSRFLLYIRCNRGTILMSNMKRYISSQVYTKCKYGKPQTKCTGGDSLVTSEHTDDCPAVAWLYEIGWYVKPHTLPKPIVLSEIDRELMNRLKK